MGFKEQIAADIKNVFLREDEFAETIDFDGQSVIVCMELNDGREPLQKESSSLATFKWDRCFSVAKQDMPRKPEPGDLVQINSGEYQEVVKALEEMGMYIVYLTGNEA